MSRNLPSCPVCGAPLDPDDRFCPNCGADVGAAIVPLTAIEPAWGGDQVVPWTGSKPLLTLDIDYPDRLSRWKIFVKWLLAVPHLLVLWALSIAVNIAVLVAWFVILFTKRYPEGLFGFVRMFMRWTANVNAYLFLQRDEYPPFGEGPYPVRLDLAYPSELSRWLIFVKWLLIIPNAIVFYFVALAMFVAVFVAWWVILITGSMPRGLFDFITGASRWGYRINAYTWLMTDKYPPFSLD